MSGKFKDAQGREWTWPAFSLKQTNRLRDEHKLNLRDLLKRDNAAASEAINDDELLFKIFTDLCKPQIEERQLSEEDVTALWDEVTFPAAKDALLERFFTFSQGPKKAAIVMAEIRRMT